MKHEEGHLTLGGHPQRWSMQPATHSCTASCRALFVPPRLAAGFAPWHRRHEWRLTVPVIDEGSLHRHFWFARSGFKIKHIPPRNTAVRSDVAAVAPTAQGVRWHADICYPADLTRVHCMSGWLTGRDMGVRDGYKHFCRPRRRTGNCNSRSFKGSYLPRLQGQAVQYVMTITKWHGVTIQSILFFNSTPVITAEVRSCPSVTPRALTPGTGLRCKFPTSCDCSDQSYIKYILFSTVVNIPYYCWILLFLIHLIL